MNLFNNVLKYIKLRYIKIRLKAQLILLINIKDKGINIIIMTLIIIDFKRRISLEFLKTKLFILFL